MSDSARTPRLDVATLALAAGALAGFATMLFELGWLRRVGAALPGTVPAAGVVVPALLLAWAVGSAIAGRRADRVSSPLAAAARWFALAALTAWLAPRALGLLASLVPDGTPWRRLIVGAGPILPVGLLLGGAVPLLARARRRTGLAPGRATGMVACAVGVGGAAGAALFVPTLLSESFEPTSVGVVALVLAAGVAALLARFEGEADERRAEEVVERAPASLGLVLLAVSFLAGALLVGGQLGALRFASQLRGDSVATTAEVLGALHVGMALGAWWLARGSRSGSACLRVAWLLGVAALGLALPLVAWDTLAELSPWSWSLAVAGTLGVGAGSVVTAASIARTRGPERFGSWVGDLGAASTVGSLLGGLVFLAVLMPDPGLGTPGAARLFVLIGGVVAITLALGVAFAGRRADGHALGVLGRALAGLFAVVVGAGLAFVVQSGELVLPWRSAPDDAALVARREGPYGVVSVVATTAGDTRLKIDNRFGLGGSTSAIEWRMGRIAAAFAPEARKAALLGIGRGHTLGGLAEVTPATIDAVERNGDILALELPLPRSADAAPVTVIHDDARAHLAARADTYDLVVGDLFFPWMSGAAEMFTVEQLLTVRRSLTDDGIYVQWLPLHQLPWRAFGSITQSVLQVFPDARLFVAQPLATQPLVALVCGLGRGLPAGDAIDALYARAPSPLGPNAAVELHDLAVCDAWTLVQQFDDLPRVTTKRPVSELWSLRQDHDEAFIARTNMRLLAQLSQPLTPADVSTGRTDVTADMAREISRELRARSTAQIALLISQAASLALVDNPEMLKAQRDGLEREIDGALLAGWRAFPGHFGLRTALAARATALRDAERLTVAGSLLEGAHQVYPDPVISGLLGGLLLQLGYDVEALEILEQSVGETSVTELVDRTLLVNYASALVRNGRDDAALDVFRRARAVYGSAPLPARVVMLLGILEDEAAAIATAQQLLASMDPTEPWRATLTRLVGG